MAAKLHDTLCWWSRMHAAGIMPTCTGFALAHGHSWSKRESFMKEENRPFPKFMLLSKLFTHLTSAGACRGRQ